MVFNRHLKALNLCNHSDTIACVLYELLVNLELINVGFPKPTIKVPQVSVLFNFQGPAVLSRFLDSLYIIYQILSFVKKFSESFLKKFSSKNGVQAVGKGSSGCHRGLGSRDSLIIIATGMTFVNRFLQVSLIFSTKFEGEVWARCILG